VLWRQNSLDWLKNSDTAAPSGRGLYYLQFSLQAASPETFGHTLVFCRIHLLKLLKTSYPDDDDRDGHRNVGILRTPNAADSPRRLYQLLKLVGTISHTDYLKRVCLLSTSMDELIENVRSFLCLEQWYSTFFPPVPLETLFHSTLYPQSCWCIIQVIHNYI
jgi:hypothetical protein